MKWDPINDQVHCGDTFQVKTTVWVLREFLFVDRYEHLRKEATDYRPADIDNVAERWRKPIETAVTTYTHSFYKYGVTSVYATSAGGNVTIIACIESHQFQPKNFWNGRWRSQWSVTFPETGGKAELTGVLKVQVKIG